MKIPARRACSDNQSVHLLRSDPENIYHGKKGCKKRRDELSGYGRADPNVPPDTLQFYADLCAARLSIKVHHAIAVHSTVKAMEPA